MEGPVFSFLFKRQPPRQDSSNLSILVILVFLFSTGMEGHARAADVRLEKYFPGESFDLHPVRNFITEY